MNNLNFENLVKSLLDSNESEWMEFKLNKNKSEEIGKNISAISNSLALLDDCNKGYIFWGKNDKGELIGTSFKPNKEKKGNEELKNWLLKLLNPQVDFRIHEGLFEGKYVVILEIPSASNQPIRFDGTEYIRIGSYTKKLKDHPEKERTLWRSFDATIFEEKSALENIKSDKVLKLIDYPNYFKKLNQPIPESHESILEHLKTSKVIKAKNSSGIYDITNLGAILFCNDFGDFTNLIKKTPRVIIYKGNDRNKGIREKEFSKGYAIEFENIMDYIDSQIPKNEEIARALRVETSMYPMPAIRELVANALVHQDFNEKGSSPMIEIFSDRIEISNPGKPLIDTLRFIDQPPKSRNESIVKFMRRINICEDRGSGIDKVISQIELYQLPPPDFRKTDFSTIAFLFATKEFSKMSMEERVRACYQHTCLQWVSRELMNNSSLRKRFGISDKNYSMASRIIKTTLDKKLIKTKSGYKKQDRYIPFWA